MTHNVLSEPGRVDEAREIDAGIDALDLEQVDEVLGRDHARRTTVAAVGAAAHAADRGVDDEGVLGSEQAQHLVGRQQREPTTVVQMQMHLRERRPPGERRGDGLLDGARRAPRHRVTKPELGRRHAMLRPGVDLELDQSHSLLETEGPKPVGSPRGIHRDDRIGPPLGNCRGDRRGHGGDLVGLRASGVPAYEDIAQVQLGTYGAGNGDRGCEFGSALGASRVEDERGVGDAVDRSEACDELLDLGHLRHPAGAHERADDDVAQAGAGQSVEEAHLVVEGDVDALDLHALAHALLDHHHGGVTLM